MRIGTYTTWANRNGKSTVYAGHPKSVGRRFIRRAPPLTRATILRDAGFRQVSGGMLPDCGRRTETRGEVLTPRQAVERFLNDRADDSLTEAVYYNDGADYYGVIVWAK